MRRQSSKKPVCWNCDIIQSKVRGYRNICYSSNFFQTSYKTYSPLRLINTIITHMLKIRIIHFCCQIQIFFS